MRRFWRRPAPERPAASAASTGPVPARIEITVTVAPGRYPACSQCGRDQFPIVGGWDPPICQDCDAAINEDAMWSEEA